MSLEVEPGEFLVKRHVIAVEVESKSLIFAAFRILILIHRL